MDSLEGVRKGARLQRAGFDEHGGERMRLMCVLAAVLLSGCAGIDLTVYSRGRVTVDVLTYQALHAHHGQHATGLMINVRRSM